MRNTPPKSLLNLTKMSVVACKIESSAGERKSLANKSNNCSNEPSE
jgi:hypothetical protein